MQVVIEITTQNGNTYVGHPTNDMSDEEVQALIDKEDLDECSNLLEAMTEQMYEMIGNLSSFKMKLEDGSFLVLGQDAISNSVMIIKEFKTKL